MPRRTSSLRHAAALALSFVLAAGALPAQSDETILQYFNTSWREITYRMPEIAEAGYSALWLPPPFKGASGTYSVGFDTFDRFDLGDRDQMGTVPTKYGTKAELLTLIEIAHRFGLRVYFDNVMAHTGGPLDPVEPGTLFPGTPGFVPEDFHLVRKPDGGWRKASDAIDYNDEWQVLNRNPFAWDIAQENPNTSFNPNGGTEGQDYPKWVGARHPGQTALYPDTDLPVATNQAGDPVHTFADKEPFVDANGNGKFDWNDGNGNGQHDPGESSEPFTDTGIDPSHPARQTAAWGFGDGRYNMGNPVAEDVNQMLFRQVRWFVDVAKADGFRLDAVKHVPFYFFGKVDGGDRDFVNWGYNGQIQEQFNVSRGFDDWPNHRNSAFDNGAPRDDALLFGEHLGAPPDPGDYLNAGMRIASDDFLNRIGGFNGIGNSLFDLAPAGFATRGVDTGMMYCLSHDNTSMAGSDRPAAHKYMLARAGIPIVYTDGYNESGAPDYFPKPAGVPFLGQFGANWVTGPLRVRRDFVRGDQITRWDGDRDFVAWEMRDKRENPAMTDDAGTILIFMMARNYTGDQGRNVTTNFLPGTRLRNYSEHGGSFFATVQGNGELRDDGGNFLVVPSGGYFAFSQDVPEEPSLWQGDGAREPIEIYQFNGAAMRYERAPEITYLRRDGRNGDPDYAHLKSIPRVTDGTNLRFLSRTDGAAINVLMKLDGGIDLNSQMGMGPMGSDRRDNRPGSSRDLFLGYEQMQFVNRVAEKFAARSIARNVIGSRGCETYEATIGNPGFIVNNGAGESTETGTVRWAYHDPAATNQISAALQFTPAPQGAGGQPVTVWLKSGYQGDVHAAHLYYTIGGASYPEGIAGEGSGETQVVPFAKFGNGDVDGAGQTEWWSATLPALPNGTLLRYKIGAHRNVADVRESTTPRTTTLKRRMQTLFHLTGFDASTVAYYPHNDRGKIAVGLGEGFHVLRTRAFLPRTGKASLFRTQTQTFYYDAVPPSGAVPFPAEGDTLGGSTYGVVALADSSVSEVWYRITDSNAANDDSTTGETNGNGTWVIASNARALLTSGTAFTREWRFDFRNIPASGAAQIAVRFKEPSSSPANALDDAQGHFTTITRNVNTGSPVHFRIGFPAADGDTVGAGYVMKALFDKSLGNGIPTQDLLDEFSIHIASTDSGQPANAVLQDRSAYAIVYSETENDDALAFALPNLYNGDPAFLHHLRVVHTRGGITLSDSRLVRAQPAALPDSDGDLLPDFWELLHGLDANNPDGVHGAQGDFDGDGTTNLQEFLANTNPILPDIADFPIRGIASNPDGGFTLTFPVHPNRNYRVRYSGDLVDWFNAGDPFHVPEAEPSFQWHDDGTTTSPEPWNTPTRFYLLEISVP